MYKKNLHEDADLEIAPLVFFFLMMPGQPLKYRKKCEK